MFRFLWMYMFLNVCVYLDLEATPSPTVPDLTITSTPGQPTSSNSKTFFSDKYTCLYGDPIHVFTINYFLLQISPKIPSTCDSFATEWKRLWNPARWVWFVFFLFKYGMHGGMELCNNHCLLLFHLGSAEEMFCKVLTECQTADYTEVTWLVNSQSVESSYLDGRALQGGRRYAAALY